MTANGRLISRAQALASYLAPVLICAAGTVAGTPMAQAADVLINCANEGKSCIAPNANTIISYGKNGAVLTVVGVTEIKCDNDSFKGDPLRGQDKLCSYTINPDNFTWTQCAKEGDDCNFTGAKMVRYGASKWVYGAYVNGVKCSNGTFGDPDRGNDKRCYVGN